MAIGKVKWFKQHKGYGFIIRQDQSGLVFVHFSAVEELSRRGPGAGDEVEVDIDQDTKGLRARRVKLVRSANAGADAESTSNPARST